MRATDVAEISFVLGLTSSLEFSIVRYMGTDKGNEMNSSQEFAPIDTAHTHVFLVSGCRWQFAGNHDHAECWAEFMKFQGQPEGTTYSEFYEKGR